MILCLSYKIVILKIIIFKPVRTMLDNFDLIGKSPSLSIYYSVMRKAQGNHFIHPV